ncbi:C-type lectin domain family 1 member B isoform X1 [Sigmodon hispidus]
MQDEDGYITLNIKPRKPTLSSDDSASSWWRVMALILLISSMGLVVGLATFGIMSVTQQKYLLAEKESLSTTLQQLAKKFCQELIKQTELKTKATFEHKCSPCASQWRYHGDSCYGFFRQNLTWEEGQEYCADQNATLVKAANQRTVEYLAARTTSIRWLGLSRQNSNKDWKWEDGSALRKNVIDLSGNTRGNMNCAYLSKGQIHAASCKDRHYLMCERRAGLTRVDQLL